MVFGTRKLGLWGCHDSFGYITLPNLSNLEFPSGLQLDLYINLIIPKASQLQLFGKPGPCCNLQNIELGRCYDDNIFFDFITSFTQLQYAKSFTFGDTVMLGEDFEGFEVPAPHITHLSFTRADINPQTISPLLEHFPSLTHFSYIHKSRDGVPYPFLSPTSNKESSICTILSKS